MTEKDRVKISDDVITPGLLSRYEATVGGVDTGGHSPHGLHWCLATPTIPTAELGPDGHPANSAILPETLLPRRMWASSEVEFLAPLPTAGPVQRTSTVLSTENKSGASGELVFVRVEHMTSAGGAECVREVQTLVYREASKAASLLPASKGYQAGECDFSETWMPTPQMLFRYSALTFNTHRIHYDAAYAQSQEGYPALVVHGPMMASLLLRLATGHLGHGAIKGFAYRGRSPAYCGQNLHLEMKLGDGDHDLTVFGADGRIVMSAKVTT